MSLDIEDHALPMRQGEELDLAQLRTYLRSTPEFGDESGTLRVGQFPGGHSNLTYLLQFGDREFILRRPPRGSKVRGAHDMGREFRVLSRLSAAYDKAPTPLLFCEDEAVIGGEFYLMERLRGLILRKEFPETMAHDEALHRLMSHSCIDTLVELHALDYRTIGLGDLGRPDGYVERQVAGWTKRYNNAKTHDIAAVDILAKWLVDHIPLSSGASLIHNDYKFDNLVLDATCPEKVLGILDWEMTTIGDPLMDLGTALSYWVEASDPEELHSMRFGPTHLPGMLKRSELAQRYAAASGKSLDSILFYYVFGLFKTAGVVQQIYYRYHKGLTKDSRFASFLDAVRVLSAQGQAAIARGSI